jgi:hypothetical protein
MPSTSTARRSTCPSLTERVIVARRPAGPEVDPTTTFERWDIHHVGEPARLGVVPLAEHWEIYDRDELIATWDTASERV